MSIAIVEREGSAWKVVTRDTGKILAAGLSNSRAWREADRINQEVERPADVRRDFCDLASKNEERQIWFSSLLGISEKRGYKKGWAPSIFKERFGEWPDGLDKTPTKSAAVVNIFLRDRASRAGFTS